MQLRIYAQHYRSLNTLTLPDGFEARVTSYQEKERFIYSSGVKISFAYFITLPFIAYTIFIFYVRGIRTHLNSVLSKPDHYSTQAALVCVGQIYTLYVAIMDAMALSQGGIATYMFIIIIIICVAEFVLLLHMY